MADATEEGGIGRSSDGGDKNEEATETIRSGVLVPTSPSGAKRSPVEIDLTGLDCDSDETDSDGPGNGSGNGNGDENAAASAEQLKRSRPMDHNANAGTITNANTKQATEASAAAMSEVVVRDLPKPKRGKLIRDIILPRTDPDNPKSTFGLNVKKSDAGRTIATFDYPSSDLGQRLGLKPGCFTVRANDVIVAVNDTVVYNVASEKAELTFKDVVRTLKQTAEGQPLKIDVLRYDDARSSKVTGSFEAASPTASASATDARESTSARPTEAGNRKLVPSAAVAAKPEACAKTMTVAAPAREAISNIAAKTTTEPQGAPIEKTASPIRATSPQQRHPPHKMQSPSQKKRTQKQNQQGKPQDAAPLFIVEIPKSTKVGDLLTIQIPPTSARQGQVLGVVCPDNIIANPPRRYIRIVLPDEEAPPISGATKRMHAPSSPAKGSPRTTLRISSPSINRKRQLVSSDEEYGSGADVKWEIQWEDYEQSSSRVGRAYQVSAFPKAKPRAVVGTSADVTQRGMRERGSLRELEDWSNEPPLGYDQIWDPQKADEAIRGGEDIDAFIDALPTNEKAAGMNALHDSDYIVADARIKLDRVRSHNAPDVHGAPLTKDQTERFRSEVTKTSKSFVDIASALGASVVSVLVHYYRVYKQSDDYKQLKHRLHHEMDVCYICDDGGDLIICDSCVRAFHRSCLDPPLTEIPEGDWHCPQCVRKTELTSRIPEARPPSQVKESMGSARRRSFSFSSSSSSSSVAAPQHKQCRVPGCHKFKQHACDDMCRQHLIDAELAKKKGTGAQAGTKQCSVQDCTKFKQSACDGMCKSHWVEAQKAKATNEKANDSDQESKDEAADSSWKCLNCARMNPSEKRRCRGCSSWPGGRKPAKVQAPEELSVSDVSIISSTKGSGSSGRKRPQADYNEDSTETEASDTESEDSSVMDASVVIGGSDGEEWRCHRCDQTNPSFKLRCSACKAWKGGKKPSRK